MTTNDPPQQARAFGANRGRPRTEGHVGLVVLGFDRQAGSRTGPPARPQRLSPAATKPAHRRKGALLAPGRGDSRLLAVASTRLTSQPQRWALMPGVALDWSAGLARTRPSRPGQAAPRPRPAGSGRYFLVTLVASSFSPRRAGSLDKLVRGRGAPLPGNIVVLSLIASRRCGWHRRSRKLHRTRPRRAATPNAVNGHPPLPELALALVARRSFLFNGLGENGQPKLGVGWWQANVSATARVLWRYRSPPEKAGAAG